MEPKIGIIVCGFDGDRQFIPNPYIQSVRYSKGLPLIIPVVRSDRLLSEYIQLCDGFLFCGGEDITPLLSGEDPCPWYGGTDVTVDLFHIRLMRQILRTRKPVLAISHHMQETSSRSKAGHRVRTERGSLIRQCFGPLFEVNSFHHQAINTPGTGVHVSARAQDGTVEAVELEGYPFAVGVQWHPECMYRTSPETRLLFREFVKKV